MEKKLDFIIREIRIRTAPTLGLSGKIEIESPRSIGVEHSFLAQADRGRGFFRPFFKKINRFALETILMRSTCLIFDQGNKFLPSRLLRLSTDFELPNRCWA